MEAYEPVATHPAILAAILDMTDEEVLAVVDLRHSVPDLPLHVALKPFISSEILAKRNATMDLDLLEPYVERLMEADKRKPA